MRGPDRGAVILGAMALLVALGGAAAAWQRWRPFWVVTRGLPLPADVTVVRMLPPSPLTDPAPGEACSLLLSTRMEPRELLVFYDREMGRRGWRRLGGEPRRAGGEPRRAAFRSRSRAVRLVVRQEGRGGGTRFLLRLRPCPAVAFPGWRGA